MTADRAVCAPDSPMTDRRDGCGFVYDLDAYKVAVGRIETQRALAT